MPWGDGLGKGDLRRLEGGAISNGIATAQRGETPAAPESTRDGVGLGDPIERCLARTSQGNRRRVGRELQMAEYLADHLGLGDGGDNPQRPLTAKRTGSHSSSEERRVGKECRSRWSP